MQRSQPTTRLWCKIRTDGDRGWVSLRYIAFGHEARVGLLPNGLAFNGGGPGTVCLYEGHNFTGASICGRPGFVIPDLLLYHRDNAFSSVSIAGVLLVFCYLIVPSVAAMLYADRIGPRLAIGWSMGTIVSALGIYLSVKLDLPTGAAMVCTFGLVLILMALVKPLFVRGEATRRA